VHTVELPQESWYFFTHFNSCSEIAWGFVR
jgi:hypothetical protein